MPSQIDNLISAVCDVVNQLQILIQEIRGLKKTIEFATGLGNRYMKIRSELVGLTPKKISEAIGMAEGFKVLLIFNNDLINSNTIYLGDSSGVTIETGFPLPAGKALPVTIQTDKELWAVSTGANTEIRIMEIK